MKKRSRTAGKTELFSINKDQYGDRYSDHLFEQYRMFVESVEKVSDRRQQANNHFIAVNSALLSVIGLSFQTKILNDQIWLRSLLSIIGVVICIIFYFLIRSYKQLNTGKFAVIHKIEDRLPLALYRYEWEVLGKGEDVKKYYPFSHVELLLPWVFGIIYFALGVF